MRARRALAASCVVVLVLVACAEEGPATGVVTGDAARIEADVVASLSSDQAIEVAAAVNAFGFDLLRAVERGGSHTVVSPLSVATLLAMVVAGAGGDTATQMVELLQLDGPRDDRLAALQGQLAGAGDVTLSVSNALWAAEGVPFEADYLAHVRERLGATVETADLGATRTAEDIDAWVDEETRGLIDGIAEELGLPDPDTRLVLANAVYFLGEWTVPFDPQLTSDRPFTLDGGEVVDVPTMHQGGRTWAHAVGDGYEVLRLPYGDDERFALHVLLPDEGTALSDLLGGLDAAGWAATVRALGDRHLDVVAIPSFELAWAARIGDDLAALGMDLAFSSAADFQPMSPAGMWLGDVVHKTYVRVDEVGTEAAAVAAAEMDGSAEDTRLEIFAVDRPFAFAITDARTGVNLFLGAVADPRA
jgi:serine protease inhibitor